MFACHGIYSETPGVQIITITDQMTATIYRQNRTDGHSLVFAASNGRTLHPVLPSQARRIARIGRGVAASSASRLRRERAVTGSERDDGEPAADRATESADSPSPHR